MQKHIIQMCPEEACGLVGGVEDSSKVVYEVTNSLRSPVRFLMDASEQVRALIQIEKSGLDLLAIYHSHPKGPDRPSQTDMDEFLYPGTASLIWYLEYGFWNCKAFMLSTHSFQSIPLSVIEDE